MKRFLIGAIAIACLFGLVPEAKAQVVNGYIYYRVAGGNIYPAPGFTVMFCKENYFCAPPSSPTIQGLYGVDVRYGEGYYYMYTWRNDWYWGSDTYPIGRVFISGTLREQSIHGVSHPRALPPVAVNPPNNSVNRPTSFALQWSDGLDAYRRDPNWPVTYDIYASGNEFPENLVFSNIPCNGIGTCSVNVSGLVYTTRYQWRVVAKIRSPVFVPNFGDNIYQTSSAILRFSTMFDPSTPTYSFRTSNGRYLTAPNGGGGDFNATATGINSLTSMFKIKDINGGLLMSGDSVNIQTNRNYYAMAYNGGGGDVDTSGWAMSWETFTIIKVGGTGEIRGGDAIALQGSNGIHYVVAEGGGGGTVNCNRTSIGPWETFTLIQQ